MAVTYFLLLGCVISHGLACILPPPCFYNGQSYFIGEPIDTQNECQYCECTEADGVQCSTPTCPDPECEPLVYEEGQCCPTCLVIEPPPPTTPVPGCFHGDQWYDEGQAVGDDPCQHCECFHGEVICAPGMTCPSVENCENPVVPDGKCCAECPEGCLFDWQWFDVGDVVSEEASITRTCLGDNIVSCSDESC